MWRSNGSLITTVDDTRTGQAGEFEVTFPVPVYVAAGEILHFSVGAGTVPWYSSGAQSVTNSTDCTFLDYRLGSNNGTFPNSLTTAQSLYLEPIFEKDLPPAGTWGTVRTLVHSTYNRFGVYYAQGYPAGSSVPVSVRFASNQDGGRWVAVEQVPGLTVGNPVVQSNGQVQANNASPSTTLTAGAGALLVTAHESLNYTMTGGTGTALFDREASVPIAGRSNTTTPTTPTITFLSSSSVSAIIALETAAPAAVAQAEVAWAQMQIPLAVPVPATTTPGAIGSTFTIPTATPDIPVPAAVTPSVVAATFTIPDLTVALPTAVTPDPATAVYTIPMPSPVGHIPVLITARLDAMFYRQVDRTELALVPLGNSQPLGFRRSETWEKVSSRFVMNQGTHDLVMALMTSVWPVLSLAPQAALTLAINAALQAAGYRAPGGFDLDGSALAPGGSANWDTARWDMEVWG